MKNAIHILIILSLGALIILQRQNITSLSSQMKTQQEKITQIQELMESGYTQTVLALKISMANKDTIKSMQRKKIVRVTAYSPRLEETDETPLITASNRKVRHGIVAVSRDLFDQGWVFGRKIYIKKLGIFTIEDLMAGSKRNQIDIFMFDTEQALHFGKRTMEAHLLSDDAGDCPVEETAQLGTDTLYSMN
ncbi:3D domain-containing protein [Desulfovibrio subterraneus]|nr:3D domain-containing protein [Desulfovibrio subterraneus]